MNRREFVAAVASLSITSIAGCADQPQNMSQEEIEWTELTYDDKSGSPFYRAVDREAGVVIYANEWAEAGFEIIPIEQTDL